jgi:hypothetical protein
MTIKIFKKKIRIHLLHILNNLPLLHVLSAGLLLSLSVKATNKISTTREKKRQMAPAIV